MFTLPTTATADILGTVSSIFSDVYPIITLVMGVSLGLFVIASIVDMVRDNTTRREVAQVLRETDDLLK